MDLNSKEIYKAGIDARNAEYYEGFTEEQDFFAVLDDGIMSLGQKTLDEIAPEYKQ